MQGPVFQNHQEQCEEIDMDLHDKDDGPGVDNDAELAALHAMDLRARVDEICARNRRDSR